MIYSRRLDNMMWSGNFVFQRLRLSSANRPNYQKRMEKVEPIADYVIQLMNNRIATDNRIDCHSVKDFTHFIRCFGDHSRFRKSFFTTFTDLHSHITFVSSLEMYESKMHADVPTDRYTFSHSNIRTINP